MLFEKLRGKVLERELLSKHTSLKIGGPADYWVEPEDVEDLKNAFRICKKNGIQIIIFGFGSNLLVPDEGLRAAVFNAGSHFFKSIKSNSQTMTAGSGVPNTLFIQQAAMQGFGGFEFLTGIPGNIGGAIAMNAGSHQQSVDAILESVRLVDFEGNEKVLTKNQIPFRYRSSGIKEAFIVEGIFRLPLADPSEVQRKLDEYRDHRYKTQDLQHPSAGCMFKNPLIPGCPSGTLIDEAGLKGKRVGKAQVSEKHGNYIINLGGATAEDVKHLILEIKEQVHFRTGIELEMEVKIL